MIALLQYPHIDPVVFRIGKVVVSWYLINWLIMPVVIFFVLRFRYRKGTLFLEKTQDLGTLAFYCFYGVLLGARLSYVLFYYPQFYWDNPLEIAAVWHGGLSFHGGLFGGIVGIWFFCRRHRGRFLQYMDAIGLVLPLGLGLGRLTNFINGELYGRVSDVPWAMVFPRGGPEPRHPSQLYEAILEGPVIFLVMYLVYRTRPKDGTVSGVGLLGYGIFRFIVEFFRQPDAQLGTVLGPLSMGQLMCLAMMAAGIALLFYLRTQPPSPPPNQPGS